MAEYLTLLGEAYIVYGKAEEGMPYCEKALEFDGKRAMRRIAEYEFYECESTESGPLFEMLHAETKDPRYLADLMYIELKKGNRGKAAEYVNAMSSVDTDDSNIARLNYYIGGTEDEKRTGLNIFINIPSLLRNDLTIQLE